MNEFKVWVIRAVERKLRGIQDEYREACEDWYQMGYRPEVCIHGTNQWTDYDNICGGCEGGEFTEYSNKIDRLRYARGLVSDWLWRVEDINKRRQKMIREIVGIGGTGHDLIVEFVNTQIPNIRSPFGIMEELQSVTL